MLKDLIVKNRSCRRFFEDHVIDSETLRDLVECARLSASGANLQPLKYILSREPRKNSLIFSNIAWAGYLKDWLGPEEGERPSAYIIILGDTTISPTFGCDHGISAQSILLAATEKGLGGCVMNSVKRPELKRVLEIRHEYEILLVIAIGKPKEHIVIEPVGAQGDIRYWRDSDGVHHVPKRSLDEIILSES